MANGAYLTSLFANEVRTVLFAAEVDQSKDSGHSFHIGPATVAATTVAAAGIADSTIRILGYWERTAYQHYIQLSSEELTSISTNLANVN